MELSKHRRDFYSQFHRHGLAVALSRGKFPAPNPDTLVRVLAGRRQGLQVLWSAIRLDHEGHSYPGHRVQLKTTGRGGWQVGRDWKNSFPRALIQLDCIFGSVEERAIYGVSRESSTTSAELVLWRSSKHLTWRGNQ